MGPRGFPPSNKTARNKQGVQGGGMRSVASSSPRLSQHSVPAGPRTSLGYNVLHFSRKILNRRKRGEGWGGGGRLLLNTPDYFVLVIRQTGKIKHRQAREERSLESKGYHVLAEKQPCSGGSYKAKKLRGKDSGNNGKATATTAKVAKKAPRSEGGTRRRPQPPRPRRLGEDASP